MKRLLLLALALPCVAFAQTNINVSFTYTSGAAAAAATAGTTVPAKVTSVVNSVINPNYTANGIGAQYTPRFDVGGAMGSRAPDDGATLENVYVWAKYNVQPWIVRTDSDASIHVHVTATPGATSFAGSPTAGTGNGNESAIVIPYALLDTQLEVALSRVLNSTTGYADRVRSLVNDSAGHTSALNGASYCYHTREAQPTNPSAVVPFLAYWQTNIGTGTSQTQSSTYTGACEAARLVRITLGCGGNCSSQSAVPGSPSPAVPVVTGLCTMKDAHGAVTDNYPLSFYPSTGGAAISATDCPEQALGNYATAANMASTPYLPIGPPDSVAAMNARKLAVSFFSFQNAQITATKKTSLQWLTCTLFSSCQ